MRKDTGHKIYTGSGRQGGEPYVLFGGSSIAPCAWCWVEIRSPAMYPALLYIVQGAVPSQLQGRSTSRITQNES
jgi:hypothetical protein